MKIYSSSLLEKSNENIKILSFLAITLANDKKINNTYYCHGCGETGGLMHKWNCMKLAQMFWRALANILLNFLLSLSFDPENLLLNKFQTNAQRYIYKGTLYWNL